MQIDLEKFSMEFNQDNDMISNAMLFSSTCHINQVDKGGNAYILHPLRMAMRLRTTNKELFCVALLHDTKEDCGVTDRMLYNIGMTPLVVKSIDLLTRKEGQSYEDFIEGLRGSLFALLVKYQDLKDNTDLSRTKGLTEKDFARVEKYIKAFKRVEQMIRELGYAI